MPHTMTCKSSNTWEENIDVEFIKIACGEFSKGVEKVIDDKLLSLGNVNIYLSFNLKFIPILYEPPMMNYG